MALTDLQKKEQARAELEGLIASLMSARRQKNTTAAGAARNALIEFNAPFPDLNADAEAAAAAAILDDVNQALDGLAEVAARLGPFGAMFKAAQKVASEERTELLFPRLAASAAQALELFMAFRQGCGNDIGTARCGRRSK